MVCLRLPECGPARGRQACLPGVDGAWQAGSKKVVLPKVKMKLFISHHGSCTLHKTYEYTVFFPI